MPGEKDCIQTGSQTCCVRMTVFSVHTNLAEHPSIPNPTTIIDSSLIPTHCIALARDVNTNAPKEPQPPPVLTAFTICNHLINHLSLKLSNQKGNKTKGKASVSSPCSLETPGWVPARVRSKPKALRTISDKNGHLRLFLFIDKSKPKKTFFCT